MARPSPHLAEVAKAARAWHDGAVLNDIRRAAPFVHLTGRFEVPDLDPARLTESEWQGMCQGAAELEYVRQETHQALIEAAYAEPALRALHPFTSHWALRFSTTIRHAFLDELAHGKALSGSNGSTDSTFHGITAPVAKMPDWLIGHHPQVAPHIIGEIIGDTERRLDIPRDVTAESIRTALGLDSQLPRQARLEFLAVRCPHLPRPSLACRSLRLPHPWNSAPGVGSHARNAVASLLPGGVTFQGSRFAVASGVVL